MTVVKPTTVVRDLGVTLDAELPMRDVSMCLSLSDSMLLPPAPTAFRSSTSAAQPWCHCPIVVCVRPVAVGLLQRRPRQPPVPASTLAEGTSRRRSSGSRPAATRPRITGPPGIALATDEQEDRLQAVPVGQQGIDRAGADVHHRHVDTCLERPVTEHSALSHQRRLHRAAYTSQAWREGFLSCST